MPETLTTKAYTGSFGIDAVDQLVDYYPHQLVAHDSYLTF
jgi:hypothetical protein